MNLRLVTKISYTLYVYLLSMHSAYLYLSAAFILHPHFINNGIKHSVYCCYKSGSRIVTVLKFTRLRKLFIHINSGKPTLFNSFKGLS